MLLEQATSKTVSRVLSEINGFDWEGDFKPMARQALMVLLQKRLDQEMPIFWSVTLRACQRSVRLNGHYIRHLLTEMGDLELLVPRSRKGKFL